MNDLNINKEILDNLSNYFKFNTFVSENSISINDHILYNFNPIFQSFINNKITYYYELCYYNPYELDYIVSNINPQALYHFSYYVLLDDYPHIYDYITSKKFYDLIINYKSNYTNFNTLWNIWLNINPYAEEYLLSHSEIIDYDYLSLNPICFDIISNLDDEEINLNEDLLSANPAIISYKYEEIKEKNKTLNEEIIAELYKPNRIIKYLENCDCIDDYLN